MCFSGQIQMLAPYPVTAIEYAHPHTDLKRKGHVKKEMLQPVQPATYQMTFFKQNTEKG